MLMESVLLHQKNQLVLMWRSRFPFTQKEINAFIEIPREYFIPKQFEMMAYNDKPLPTMRGKTISQPSTVMIMTHALEIKEGDIIFEIGTGSGYQTALLATLCGKKGRVISTEVIPELVVFARGILSSIGIKNCEIFEEDGSKGMKEKSPFDKIIITSACRVFPETLVTQLKIGGIIIGPVGDSSAQEMVKGIKDKDGKLSLEFLGQFIFSPMSGKYGFEE